MRLKALALFLATQLISFSAFTLFTNTKADDTQTHFAADTIEVFDVIEPENPFENLHFSERNREDYETKNEIKREDLIRTLEAMPKEHVESVDRIILDFDPRAHRGLGGKGLIILRGVNMDDEEASGVLIHELAHNVDLTGMLHSNTNKPSAFKDNRKPVYHSDPSLEFYTISWLSHIERRSNAKGQDFVSGYAMSDPFEDFAESYTYYVLQNRSFKALAATNDALQAKYNFMRDKVFDGHEFDTGLAIHETQNRPWDTTVLNYDLLAFQTTQ